MKEKFRPSTLRDLKRLDLDFKGKRGRKPAGMDDLVIDSVRVEDRVNQLLTMVDKVLDGRLRLPSDSFLDFFIKPVWAKNTAALEGIIYILAKCHHLPSSELKTYLDRCLCMAMCLEELACRTTPKLFTKGAPAGGTGPFIFDNDGELDAAYAEAVARNKQNKPSLQVKEERAEGEAGAPPQAKAA